MKLKDVCSLEAKVLINLDSILKSRDHHFTDKGPYSQSYGFSSSHVWMWELDPKEGWAPNWWFQVVMLEKTLESPLDSKEIKAVNLKGNQPWIFIETTDAEAETPVLWPPDANSWLNGKDPDAGKDWRQEEKGTTGWDGWLASPTQWTWVWTNSGSWWRTGKSLACCSPWGGKESDMTWRLNDNNKATKF